MKARTTCKLLMSIGVVGYTSHVEYENYLMKLHHVGTRFGNGSADSVLMDSLQSGDLVLFSRRWYNYHLPFASLLLLQQFCHGKYDHVGVVICDPQTAVPHILESSFHGLRIVPLENRILLSRADLIVALPVEPRPAKLDSSFVQLLLKSNVKSQFTENHNRNELYGIGIGLCNHFISKLTGRKADYLCPSVDLVMAAYTKLGWLPADLVNTRTPNNIMDRKLTCSNICDSGSELHLSECDIMIRTK